MRISSLLRAGLALGMVLAVPQVTFAAAQKAKGLTSVQPTSTNPQLRQIEITYDPANAYPLQEYQLTIAFDSSLVTPVTDVNGVGPFNAQVVGSGTVGVIPDLSVKPSVVTTTSSPIVPPNGYSYLTINGNSGEGGNQTAGDVNIFSLVFQVNDPNATPSLAPALFSCGDDGPATPAYDPLTVPLNFYIYAKDNNDFLTSYDPNNPQGTMFTSIGPDQIDPALLTTSITDATNLLNANANGNANGNTNGSGTTVPLPPGALLGLIGMLPAGWFGARARRR